MSNDRLPTQYGHIFPPRPDWLAKAPAEEVLDPGLEIIDTHHHFWDRPGNRYLVPELLADIGDGHNVVGTVYVECESGYRTDGPEAMRSVGEAEFVAGLAREAAAAGHSGVAQGFVGFVDLTLGEAIEPVLDALHEASEGRLRGIRHAAGWHADPRIGGSHHGAREGLYRDPAFHAGLKVLARRGLTLDALVYHTQHADLVALAKACPDAKICLNHTGMALGYGDHAGRLDEARAAWAMTMPEIAACPNVYLKLGGMMMRLAVFDYNAEPAPPSSERLADLWRPFIRPCIDWFGADRCTFESNYPVEKMGIGYRALWNGFKRLAADSSEAEKADLFSGTARRLYNLG